MFGNLLNTAMGVIPTQAAELRVFIGRELDDEGAYVNTYSEPRKLRGSWQAVDAEAAKELGLDVKKNYRRFYTSEDLSGVARGSSPDLLFYAGKRYDITGDADWYEQDGWKSVICVESSE